MKLDLVGAVVGHALELLNASDRMDISALAFPYGKGRSPVTLTAETPVDYVLDEVSEASVLDVVGIPLDRLVVCHKPVADLCHLNEPYCFLRSKGAECRISSRKDSCAQREQPRKRYPFSLRYSIMGLSQSFTNFPAQGFTSAVKFPVCQHTDGREGRRSFLPCSRPHQRREPYEQRPYHR